MTGFVVLSSQPHPASRYPQDDRRVSAYSPTRTRGKYSVYRCARSGHIRNGVLNKEVWEGSGGVREAARRRAGARPDLQVRPLADQREAQLWREYVDRYHYLGDTPLPGTQMRYLVTSQRRVLAVVGFGASAWKAAPRDRFIGWSVAQREARLQLVVNNARFLILPWVQVRNLASTVLARISRRLPDDWQTRYGYRPLLLETFVQSDRFAGTSYRAANWTHVGQTQGRGKLDVHKTYALPRKDIWLYPLRRDFRRRLCSPLNPPPHR